MAGLWDDRGAAAAYPSIEARHVADRRRCGQTVAERSVRESRIGLAQVGSPGPIEAQTNPNWGKQGAKTGAWIERLA